VNNLEERINHYLLISLTLSFISGLIVYRFFPFEVKTAAIISFLLLTTTLLVSKKHHELTTSFLLLTVLSLACLHSANVEKTYHRKNNINTQIVKAEEVVLTGVLHRMPLYDGFQSTIILKVHNLRLRREDHLSSSKGLVQLRLKDKWPMELVPGDELVIRATLSRPYSFMNPGGFNYTAFLASQNIRIIGRINSLSHILPLVYKKSWLHKLIYLPENIRLSIREDINRNFSAEVAGIYRALLIGDRSGLNRETLEAFKASGTMHILAISGLHLSLVATFLFFIFYFLVRRSQYLMLRVSCKKLALIATIPPLCIYSLLAGAHTPVLRSLIMVLVFILAFCIHRQRSPFTTLSLAALLILLVNPNSLFEISFQLSFVAVASIILIFPRLLKLVQIKNLDNSTKNLPFPIRFKHWLIAGLLISITATIGTAPLLLHSFNRMSTIGPVANLLLEPLLCLWSLPFGLLSILVQFFDHQTSDYLLQIGSLGIKAAIIITNFFSNFDHSTLWLPTPPFTLIFFYFASLALCFCNYTRSKTIPLFLGISLFFLYPPQNCLKSFSNNSELIFLDVGQGSSTLVTFPGGKNILIDGGGSSSSKFDVGESVIARYLWNRGISHLDAIIITHPDADHYNGVPFLLKHFYPDTLWINGEKGHDQEYDALIELAMKFGTKLRIPESNEIILKTKELTLFNINNPFLNSEHFASLSNNSNDQSLIVQLKGNHFSCLIAGDISRRVEHALVKNQINLKSLILLSPHHGSRTSNSEEFINAVKPEQIVVSAGRFKSIFFPSIELRSICKEKNIPLLVTSEIGAIMFTQNNGTLKRISFKKNI
jgi:competence protein ComEC